MTGPVLFSTTVGGVAGGDGRGGGARRPPAPAVVLTIWQPAVVLLARAGGFGGGYLSDEEQVDREQAQLADAGEEGVERARAQAMTPAPAWRRPRRARDQDHRAPEELHARLIVCGWRGRGTVVSALLGSVSHVVRAHAGRPVLIAPERQQIHIVGGASARSRSQEIDTSSRFTASGASSCIQCPGPSRRS